MTAEEIKLVGGIAYRLQQSIEAGLSGVALQLRIEQTLHKLISEVRKDQIEKDAKIASSECVESMGSIEDVGQCGLRFVSKSIRAQLKEIK